MSRVEFSSFGSGVTPSLAKHWRRSSDCWAQTALGSNDRGNRCQRNRRNQPGATPAWLATC
jgi:hypothetical protein